MKSMTGYGRAEGAICKRQVVVELRCYNHRYTDVRLKVPRAWVALEIFTEKLIRERIGRGRVECSIRSISGAFGVGKPVLDKDCAWEYLQAYKELAKEMWKETGIEQMPGLDLVAKSEGVVVVGEMIEDLDAAKLELQSLLGAALDEADRMRKTEGRALVQELELLLSKVEQMVKELQDAVPAEQTKSIEKMNERIRSLAHTPEVSEERLAQEIAILSDRMDVTEELTRLDSHVAQFRACSARLEQPVGRELDFLLQEMNREVNTLLSKLTSTKLTNLGVSLKVEVEKLREQVQNVE